MKVELARESTERDRESRRRGHGRAFRGNKKNAHTQTQTHTTSDLRARTEPRAFAWSTASVSPYRKQARASPVLSARLSLSFGTAKSARQARPCNPLNSRDWQTNPRIRNDSGEQQCNFQSVDWSLVIRTVPQHPRSRISSAK